MYNTNEKSRDFYQKFQEIKYDIFSGSLEDIKNILDHYNEKSNMSNYVKSYHNLSPLYAACLNARYKQLTGKDHPTFIIEQPKVLDDFIKSKDGVIINGKPTIYQRLKNNLTGESPGIIILPSKKDSYIDKFDRIKYDISKASLEDIKEILDYYDQDSVLINGIQYYARPNPLQGASLNARYKELTGKDHPTFLKVQKELLEEEIRKGQDFSFNNKPSIYQSLKDNTMKIGDKNHILTKTSEIIMNPEKASLEDISSLLNYYNGPPVLINGIAFFPFNDPICASKLNARYREFTGKNHPVYAREVINAINNLMKLKKKLIKAGAYDSSYFHKLEQIKQVVQQERTHNNSTGIKR